VVLIREYQANGLKVPAHITSKTLVGLAGCLLPTPEKVDQLQESITASRQAAISAIHYSCLFPFRPYSSLCHPFFKPPSSVRSSLFVFVRARFGLLSPSRNSLTRKIVRITPILRLLWQTKTTASISPLGHFPTSDSVVRLYDDFD
jgi:hypothetical protein